MSTFIHGCSGIHVELISHEKRHDDSLQCAIKNYASTITVTFLWGHWINSLRPRQNGRRFPDDILICIFVNENEWHSIKHSLKCVPKVPINNIPALVQIMAWRRPGDKPLSEPMMVSLLTHICVTRPQWVKKHWDLSRLNIQCFIVSIATDRGQRYYDK